MEPISQMFRLRPEDQEKFEQLKAQVLSDPEILSFIEAQQMTEQAVEKSISKFHVYLTERAKNSADYQPVLTNNQGFAEIAYQPTASLKEKQKNAAIRRRVSLINLPSRLKDVRLNDVKRDDIKRMPVFLKLVEFATAEQVPNKGFYIYGDMGIGKSYMMAAVVNELALRNISSTMVHYPSFVDRLNYDNKQEMVEQLKKVKVLVLDDIGAESNNAWLRDSVLQIILQHRMDNDLATFFTSNLDMRALELHFSESKSGDEVWPAKRLMERVRYLADEIHLEGDNRRHD